jgi:hypothetical protein
VIIIVFSFAAEWRLSCQMQAAPLLDAGPGKYFPADRFFQRFRHG